MMGVVTRIAQYIGDLQNQLLYGDPCQHDQVMIKQVLNIADFGLLRHGCKMLYTTHDNQRLFQNLAKMD